MSLKIKFEKHTGKHLEEHIFLVFNVWFLLGGESMSSLPAVTFVKLLIMFTAQISHHMSPRKEKWMTTP